MVSPCHNCVGFSLDQERTHLCSSDSKEKLLTQCSIVSIRTALFASFFSPSVMCAFCNTHPYLASFVLSHFLSSSPPFFPFFLSCITKTSLCFSSLTFRIGYPQHKTLKQRAEKHDNGRIISRFGQASALIFNESIYSYRGNLQWSHLTLQLWNPSSKKETNRSVCCMNLHSSDWNHGQRWL